MLHFHDPGLHLSFYTSCFLKRPTCGEGQEGNYSLTFVRKSQMKSKKYCISTLVWDSITALLSLVLQIDTPQLLFSEGCRWHGFGKIFGPFF